MILFRQGKPDGRKLAPETAARMKPLSKDEEVGPNFASTDRSFALSTVLLGPPGGGNVTTKPSPQAPAPQAAVCSRGARPHPPDYPIPLRCDRRARTSQRAHRAEVRHTDVFSRHDRRQVGPGACFSSADCPQTEQRMLLVPSRRSVKGTTDAPVATCAEAFIPC